MKVWINYVKQEFAAGLILVAADSAEEAHNLLIKATDADYPDIDLHQSYFEKDNWEEMTMLNADVLKPTILAVDTGEG